MLGSRSSTLTPRPWSSTSRGVRIHNPSQIDRSADADSLHSSLVAIHGISAHPDDTWCKRVNVGGSEERYVIWLRDAHMLPTVVPQTRIMRYGYQSQWFGEESICLKASTVALRLLRRLNRARKVPGIYPILVLSCAYPAPGRSSPAFGVYRALFRWTGDPEGPSYTANYRGRADSVRLSWTRSGLTTSGPAFTSRPPVCSSSARPFAVLVD